MTKPTADDYTTLDAAKLAACKTATDRAILISAIMNNHIDALAALKEPRREAIRQMWEDDGMTQEDIARELGIDASRVNHILKGRP